MAQRTRLSDVPPQNPKDFGKVTRQLKRASEQVAAHEARHLLTIQEQLEAISRGDFEACLAQAHHAIELEVLAPPEFSFVRQARGIRNVRRAIQHNFGSLEDQQPSIANVLVQGDLVVMIGSETGRIRKTATPYDIQFVHRFTFAEGALTHVQVIAARRA